MTHDTTVTDGDWDEEAKQDEILLELRDRGSSGGDATQVYIDPAVVVVPRIEIFASLDGSVLDTRLHRASSTSNVEAAKLEVPGFEPGTLCCSELGGSCEADVLNHWTTPPIIGYIASQMSTLIVRRMS